MMEGSTRMVYLVNLEERLKKMMEGSMRTIDLVNLENKMEENMEMIAKII